MADLLKYGSINLYFASNSPGNPLCLYGEGGSGLAVAIYYDEEKGIVGVQITNDDLDAEPFNIGEVPPDEV